MDLPPRLLRLWWGMPPSKQYNRNDALDAAMALFWRQGFESTTYDDLVQETGASRYGLYGDFGDKRDLYLAALDHYRDVMVTALLGGLERRDAGLSELVAYFERLGDGRLHPKRCPGCLFARAAMETASRDDAVAKRVKAHFTRQRRTFRRALENAKQADELPGGIDPERYAELLVGLVQGLAVMAVSGTPRKKLEQAVETALAPLFKGSI